MPVATELDSGIASFHGDGTRFFQGDDGHYFIVKADLDDYSHLRDNIHRKPTVILYCDENAWLPDLDVDFEFPPGTTHEDAVIGAGYEIA